MYIAGDLLIFIGKNSATCLLAGLVITGLGTYGIFEITFAMQPDVIDYSEYQKNSSIAGMIAVLTYFYKLDSIRKTMTDELEERRQRMAYDEM